MAKFNLAGGSAFSSSSYGISSVSPIAANGSTSYPMNTKTTHCASASFASNGLQSAPIDHFLVRALLTAWAFP
jgi:hypothetical protein